MEIQLSRPFTAADGTKQSFVNLDPVVTVGAWRRAGKASKDYEERMFFVLCELAGLTAKELDQLKLEDYNKVAEKLEFGSDPKEQPEP